MKPGFDYKNTYEEEDSSDINREDVIMIIAIAIMAIILTIAFNKSWQILPR